MIERELETPRKFQSFGGKLLAAKEIVRLTTLEVKGFATDMAWCINHKPGPSLFSYIETGIEMRSDDAKTVYDRYLLENNLLTLEGELAMYSSANARMIGSVGNQGTLQK